MSGTAIKWARRQNVGSAPMKAVLSAIASRADDKGATWASQGTLAKDTGMTDRSVRHYLSELEHLGVIVRQMRSAGRGGRLSDLITLSLHRTFNISPKALRALRLQWKSESSNRKISALPTGRRLPGNRKRTTYPIQGGAHLSGYSTDSTYPRRPRLTIVNGGFVDDREDGL